MAFDFIPKKLEDLSIIPDDLKYDYEKLFSKLSKISNEPISIDKSNFNKVKISRLLQGKIDIKSLSSNLTLSFGNGSRGGRGINNKGNAFEQEYYNAFNKWNSSEYHDYNYSFEEINKTVCIKNKSGKLVGGLNTKRPLVISENYIGPMNGYCNIGSTISDITIGETTFLSLKFGKNVSLYNTGLKKYIKDQDILANKISDEGNLLLNLFGINHKLFCNSFTKKYTYVKQKEATYDIIDIIKLNTFIKSVVGYGYWKVHNIDNKIKTINVNQQYCLDASIPKSCIVYYGGKTGMGKKVEAEVITDKFKLVFNFRSTSGSGLLTHLICDFKDL